MFYSEAQLNFDILNRNNVAKGKEWVFSGLDYYIDGIYPISWFILRRKSFSLDVLLSMCCSQDYISSTPGVLFGTSKIAAGGAEIDAFWDGWRRNKSQEYVSSSDPLLLYSVRFLIRMEC